MSDSYTRKTDVRVGDVRLPPRGRAFVVVTMNGSKVWCTVTSLRFEGEREVTTAYVERCRLVMRDQSAPEGEVLAVSGRLASVYGHGLAVGKRHALPHTTLYSGRVRPHLARLRLAAEQGCRVRITIAIEKRKP